MVRCVCREDVNDTVITNLNCHHNYRQGLSIASASSLLIVDSRFTDTNGTAPMCGVDLEPDWGFYRLVGPAAGWLFCCNWYDHYFGCGELASLVSASGEYILSTLRILPERKLWFRNESLRHHLWLLRVGSRPRFWFEHQPEHLGDAG